MAGIVAATCLSSKAFVANSQRIAHSSNGSKVAMKSRSTYQVQVVVGEDEPQDNALKRFRREVMSAGAAQEAVCGAAARNAWLQRRHGRVPVA